MLCCPCKGQADLRGKIHLAVENSALYIYICITAINFMEIHEVHSVILQSINQKRQSVSLPVNLLRKKWHLVCLTHSIGRAFSGGSQLRCYVDGVLVSSEKCR